MIIAVDFDGTLHDGEYPNIGEPLKDAVTVMRQLHDEGHTLIIWSCRAGAAYDEMIRWLEGMEIPFDCVNEQDPDNMAAYGNDTRKVYADVYIDDHNIGGIPPWRTIYRKIRGMA